MKEIVPEEITGLVERVKALETKLEAQKAFYEEQLLENISKYKRVINFTSEGYLELDHKARITDCNAVALSLLGKDKTALLHSTIDAFYDKGSVVVHFASRNHLNFEANFKTTAGRTTPLLCKRSIIQDAAGETCGYLILLTDLTESKTAQENLLKAQARYRLMYDNAVQGMYQCDLEGHFLSVNPAFAKTFGFEQTADLLRYPGGVTRLYKNPADRKVMLGLLKKELVVTNYETEMIRPDGTTIWALINARLTEDADGTTTVEGILLDNTEKRYAEEKLRQSRERFRYLAIHDDLTTLYNTRYLYKALEELIATSKLAVRPFSLVFLDMDNFKHVVDTYGHLNGSQALREVARTLKDSLEEPAFGVAYGGDEFVLVLPGKGKEEALEKVQEIRLRMKETTYLKTKGLNVNMSASYGIATYPDDAQDSESLLARADEAMFHIKTRGKDSVATTG